MSSRAIVLCNGLLIQLVLSVTVYGRFSTEVPQLELAATSWYCTVYIKWRKKKLAVLLRRTGIPYTLGTPF
jgi:hypothetical protein